MDEKLLQDLYARYAPNQELTPDRIKAINDKYGNDYRALISDFYQKYSPENELTDDRYAAIEKKYGLTTQPEKKNLLAQAGDFLFGRDRTGTAEGEPEYTQEELDELAEQYGYKQLTEQKVNEWVDQAAEDPTGTAWGSGVSALRAGIKQARNQVGLSDIYIGEVEKTRNPEEKMYTSFIDAQNMMEVTQPQRARLAKEARNLLQEKGYFNNLTERAIQKQILSNQKWRNSLERQGLDPDATMREAFKEKGIVKGLQYVGALVAQQAPQVVGAIGIGALTKNPGVVAAVLGGSAAGGDMLSSIMEKRSLTEEDVLAAWAKGAVEGGAEALFSPAVKLGGSAIKNIGARLTGKILKEGGAKGTKSVLKQALKAGIGEGSEEVAVELIGNLIDAIKEQEPDWGVEDYIRANAEAFDPDALLEVFVAGALTGAPMGALREITRTPSDEEIKEKEAKVAATVEQELKTKAREEQAELLKDNDVKIALEVIGEGYIENPEQAVNEYLDALDDDRLEAMIGKADKIEAAIEARNVDYADSQKASEGEAQQETKTVEEAETEEGEVGQQAVEDVQERPYKDMSTEELQADRELIGNSSDISEVDQEVLDMIDRELGLRDMDAANLEELVAPVERGVQDKPTLLAEQVVDLEQAVSRGEDRGAELKALKEHMSKTPEAFRLLSDEKLEELRIKELAAKQKGEANDKFLYRLETEKNRRFVYGNEETGRIDKLRDKKSQLEQELEGVPEGEMTSKRRILDIVNQEINELTQTQEAVEEGAIPEDTQELAQEELTEVEQGVGEMPVSEIEVDAERFQFKDVADKDRGVSDKLKGKKYKPELAGVVSVWTDPQDGKTYVINGHHRLDLAKRQGVKSINVMHIKADNAQEARKIGALQNIAEGNGTAIDAAKLFKEEGDTDAELSDFGLSFKDKIAADGMALAKLSDPLFNAVATGKIKENVGILIGRNISNPDIQEEFYNTIKGKNYTQGQMRIMAQDINSAQTQNVEVQDLFGTTQKEKSNFAERSKFVASVRKIISRQKNLLGKAAKGKEFLEQFGNEIDQEMSEGASKEAAQSLAIFDKYRNVFPEINQIINKGFERIQNGESSQKVVNETTKELTKRIPKIIKSETGGRGRKTETTQRTVQEETTKPAPRKTRSERVADKMEAVAEGQDGTVFFSADRVDEINDMVDELDPQGKTDMREIPRIAKTFKQFFNKPVLIHKTTQDAIDFLNGFQEGLGDAIDSNTGGFYTGESIHIIADAGGRNVSKHEFMHTMIGTIVKNDPNVFEVLFDDMLSMPEFQQSGIQEEVKTLYADDPDMMQEEMMVEFLARVGAGQIKLSEPSKNKIVQIIRVLMDALGFSIDDVSNDFREFARQVSDAMRDGREIRNAYGDAAKLGEIRQSKNRDKIKRQHLQTPFADVVSVLGGRKDTSGLADRVINAPKEIKDTVTNFAATRKPKDAYKALRAINNFYKKTHPEVRQEDLNQVTTAVDKVIDTLEGKAKVKDAREAILSIDIGRIDRKRFRSKMKRYAAGVFTDSEEKQQMLHFLDEVNEYLQQPVRSEYGDPSVQASVMAPNFKFSRTSRQTRIDNYIRRKDDTMSDFDIAQTLMTVFDMSSTEAVDAIERAMKRNYIPQVTTQSNWTARTTSWVLRPFYSASEWLRNPVFGKDEMGQKITLHDFKTNADVMYADKYAGVRALEEKVRKNIMGVLPDDLRASEKLDQAVGRSRAYRESLIMKLFGTRDLHEAYNKKHAKNSMLGKANADGVTWGDSSRYNFFRHIPEFLARKQDLVIKARQRLQREINALQDQLPDLTGRELKKARDKILYKQDALNNDVRYVIPQHIGLDNDANKTPITADYARQVVADMEAANPNITRWSDTFRELLLDEYYKILKDGKLVSDERLDALKNGTSINSDVVFDYYVPMQVDEAFFADTADISLGKIADINNIGLQKLQGAGGDKYGFAERNDTLTQLLANVVVAKEMAEQNEGRRTLASLVVNFDSKNFKIRKTRKYSYVNHLGEIVTTNRLEAAAGVKDDTVDVRKNGIPFIDNDGKQAFIVPTTQAVKTSNIYLAFMAGDPRPSRLFQAYQRISRNVLGFYRNGITSLSLGFGIQQVPADIQDALAGITVDMEMEGRASFKDKFKLRMQMANNWRKALGFFLTPGNYKSGIDRVMNNISTNPDDMSFADFWAEAQQAGMPMSWRRANYSSEEGYRELLKVVDRTQSGIPFKKWHKQVWPIAFEQLSNFNDSMENVNRLAAYITARKAGLSPQRASQIGKDITINFERKGVKDGFLRATYLFWGAAINGVKRSGKVMKALGPKGAGVIIAGAALNRLMLYGSMEEDELNDTIQSQYKNRNRVIIAIPGVNKSIDVKSPYSFMRMYYALGNGLVDVSMGKRTKADVWFDFTDAAFTAFFPMSGNVGAESFTATMLKPAAEVRNNRDYKGDPIVSPTMEIFADREVDKYKASNDQFEGTDQFFVQLLDRMYDKTGGIVDVSPAYVEYLFDAYVYVPALRETFGAVDQIPNWAGGQKISDAFANAVGFDIPDRDFEVKRDLNKALPPLKAFYRPSFGEQQAAWNFFALVDRKPIKGLTDEQFDYVLNAYEMIKREELYDDRAIDGAIKRLEKRFPDRDWKRAEKIKRKYKD